MKGFSKWVSAVAAVVFLAAPAVAADAIATGKIKSINADKKEFVLTDAAATNGAKVRLNQQASKVEDLEIGDKTLAIVQTTGDKVKWTPFFGQKPSDSSLLPGRSS